MRSVARRLCQLQSQLVRSKTTSASLLVADDGEVLFESINNKGVITLNKPSSLNAINHNMTVRIYNQLKKWEKEKSVSLVILKGVGNKAFSAGGDVRELANTASKDHDSDSSFQFLRDEYRTQYTVNTYYVPVVALANGYCMGGGCGLAVNGKYTVATELTTMSMPETAIGFYPDNGGSHFLSRLPGELGVYLGLTCAQVTGEDACNVGLASHYATCHDGALGNLENDLLSLDEPTDSKVLDVLDYYHSKCYTGAANSLCSHLSAISRVFSKATVEEIVEDLKAERTDWATYSLNSLMANSPTALKLTLRLLREAKHLDLFTCLSMELRLGRTILQNPDSDFFRGVKAVLVDKAGGAQWSPDNLSDVSDKHVSSHFLPLTQAGYEEFLVS